ncbi:MAG: N-acetylmuramic acid 6-phosphate etherase [bacterium]
MDDVERIRRLAEELEGLVTEELHPAAGELDALTTRELVGLMNREDRRVPEAVGEVLDEVARAADLVAAALSSGGRLFYAGAGTSGRLGVLDASECPPTFGADPDRVVGVIAGGRGALVRSSEGLEDRSAAGWEDLEAAGASAGDVVVGITASTRTPYVLGALGGARKAGLNTVYLTCNPGGQQGVEADVTIHPVLGPEVIAGSTRLKAGTATKLILNMITTAAFVRKGHAYGNLMVDIRPVSDKLRARARRIVMLACGVGFEEADRALREADEEVKTAVVMLRNGTGPERAREALEATGGVLRQAVGGRPPAFIEEDD